MRTGPLLEDVGRLVSRAFILLSRRRSMKDECSVWVGGGLVWVEGDGSDLRPDLKDNWCHWTVLSLRLAGGTTGNDEGWLKTATSSDWAEKRDDGSGGVLAWVLATSFGRQGCLEDELVVITEHPWISRNPATVENESPLNGVRILIRSTPKHPPAASRCGATLSPALSCYQLHQPKQPELASVWP
ncbi:hypothetical protein BDZ97DRAFT_1753052 [Flammula alnicola]|nr:hypothetical protein BDZ97DRAFT_1753052 [Flammula alnicola]